MFESSFLAMDNFPRYVTSAFTPKSLSNGSMHLLHFVLGLLPSYQLLILLRANSLFKILLSRLPSQILTKWSSSSRSQQNENVLVHMCYGYARYGGAKMS